MRWMALLQCAVEPEQPKHAEELVGWDESRTTKTTISSTGDHGLTKDKAAHLPGPPMIP